MRSFLTLNGIGAIYAFAFFVHAEMWVNTSRIERITGIHHVGVWMNLLILLVYLAASALCYLLTKNLFGRQRVKMVLPVLWIPYSLFFILAFASLYPMTNPQDKPLPAIGLILLLIAAVFPFHIVLINFLASKEKET